MSQQEIQNKVLQDLIDFCESKMVSEMKERTAKKPEAFEESNQDESDDLERMQEMARK